LRLLPQSSARMRQGSIDRLLHSDVAGTNKKPVAARGEPCPLPCMDSGLRALTAIVEFILRYCSTVFQPQRRQTARPRPERAEKASAAKRRKPALPHSAVEFSGAWWKTVVFWRVRFFPSLLSLNGAQRAAAVGPASPSGHYVEAPAAPFFRSLRVQNSRNPAGSGAMLISPILFIFWLIVPCSLALSPARTPARSPSLPAPHGIAAGTG
jgi:hypothetical protein